MLRFEGGDFQRSNASRFSGYSAKAQCTGNPRSYLVPIRNTMQSPIEGRGSQCRNRRNNTAQRAYLKPIRGSMQKPERGLPENVGDRSAIGGKTAQKHVENSTAKLPKPSMLQPIYTLNKGAIAFSEQQFSLNTDYPVIIALETKYIL